jgi:hypothetical protein
MSEKKKPSTPNKTGLIARATSTIADRARITATAARKGAKVAAGATTRAAKVAAQATADFAKKTGKFLDAQSRSFLEAEFAKHKPVGAAKVARLRQAHSVAKPAEIVELLSAEFMKNEKGVSAESERFVTASTHYVLTLNEIYGDKVRDNMQRQVLLYVVLAANSKAAQVVTQVGLVALSFASKRFAAIATVVAIGTELLTKSAGKMSWVTALAKLAGIRDVGRKSASWVVVNASLKILGPAPASWPAAAKKPMAKKPTAKKPVARKPQPSA